MTLLGARRGAAALLAALVGWGRREAMARVLELTTRMKAVQRSHGDSATAKAAYRACCKIECEREGRTHDYSRKHGLEASEIHLPDDAPTWAKDRAKLWNAAEKAERNKDKRAKSAWKEKAQTARDYVFAFPAELTKEGRLRVARAVALHLVQAHGVAADFNIHEPGREGDHRNFHCHLMFTTRRMTAKGLGAKTREWDERAKDGSDEPSLAKQLRAFVAKALNDALAVEGKAGLVRVEHQSFAARGSGQKPQQHRGPAKTHIVRKDQARDRRAWFQRVKKEQAGRHAKELAALKLRQDFGLQGKLAGLAQRGREGAAAIRRELAEARAADRTPDGLRRVFLIVTGRAGREAFDRQAREGQRVEAARAKLADLKAELRAERSSTVAGQVSERAALIERHGAEDRQLQQALVSREQLDRAREVIERTPEQQTRSREREGQGRSIGRELSP